MTRAYDCFDCTSGPTHRVFLKTPTRPAFAQQLAGSRPQRPPARAGLLQLQMTELRSCWKRTAVIWDSQDVDCFARTAHKTDQCEVYAVGMADNLGTRQGTRTADIGLCSGAMFKTLREKARSRGFSHLRAQQALSRPLRTEPNDRKGRTPSSSPFALSSLPAIRP